MHIAINRIDNGIKDALMATPRPTNLIPRDLSQQNHLKRYSIIYIRMISGLVKIEELPLDTMMVKLCVSDSEGCARLEKKGDKRAHSRGRGRRWTQQEKEGGAFLLGTRMLRK